MELEQRFIQAFADLEEKEVMEIANRMIEKKIDSLSIIEYCRQGFKIIGDKYHYGIYYLSDLIMASEIFRIIINLLEINSLLSTYAKEDVDNNKPKIVFGTIHGDIHDLGKDIMIFVLRSSGFQVYDLGVNVPPEKFIEAVEETGANLIGVSVLLTFCFNEIKKLMDLLKETGLRNKVKVIIGGYPVNEAFREYIDADYCGSDAVSSVGIFKKALKEIEGC